MRRTLVIYLSAQIKFRHVLPQLRGIALSCRVSAHDPTSHQIVVLEALGQGPSRPWGHFVEQGLQREHRSSRGIHEMIEALCVLPAFAVGVAKELLRVVVRSAVSAVDHRGLLYKHRNYYLADLLEGPPSMVDLDAFLDGTEALVECVLPLHLYVS